MSEELQIDHIAEAVLAQVAGLRGADFDTVERIKSELIGMCEGENGSRARDALDTIKRDAVGRSGSARRCQV